jgi:AraC family transcriptional regulator
MTQHVLVVHHANQTIQAERTMAGRTQAEHLDRGQIVIIPAQTPHKIRWHGDGDFTLLLLDPLHLAQTAYESVKVDRVEIMPQFARLDPLLYQLGLTLKAEMAAEGSDRVYAESLATLLSAHLLRHYSAWQQTLPFGDSGLSKQQLRLVLDFMQSHLHEELSLDVLTAVVQLSPFYFMRRFQESTGSTPHQYLQQLRVEQAKRLLKQPSLTIADIAQQVGFHSDRQFSSVFHKQIGVTPSTYRENQ